MAMATVRSMSIEERGTDALVRSPLALPVSTDRLVGVAPARKVVAG
jgi:hypothetical protein